MQVVDRQLDTEDTPDDQFSSRHHTSQNLSARAPDDHDDDDLEKDAEAEQALIAAMGSEGGMTTPPAGIDDELDEEGGPLGAGRGAAAVSGAADDGAAAFLGQNSLPFSAGSKAPITGVAHKLDTLGTSRIFIIYHCIIRHKLPDAASVKAHLLICLWSCVSPLQGCSVMMLHQKLQRSHDTARAFDRDRKGQGDKVAAEQDSADACGRSGGPGVRGGRVSGSVQPGQPHSPGVDAHPPA